MITVVKRDVTPPDEALVGRIVMRQAIEDWSAFKHPQKVLAINGDECSCVRLAADFDGKRETWVFADKVTNDVTTTLKEDVRVICDTAEEVNRIVAFSEAALKQIDELRGRLAVEFNELADPNARD
jgi:hypothetical protein